jgi:stage II sporulation protein AA (anti-sigma F factor antagonist)
MIDPEKFEITDLEKVLLITLDGDLEITTIKRFEEWIIALANNTSKDIALDFSRVNYLDSSGISVLLKLSKLLKSKRKRLKLTKLPERISQILEISSLVDELEQHHIEIV